MPTSWQLRAVRPVRNQNNTESVYGNDTQLEANVLPASRFNIKDGKKSTRLFWIQRHRQGRADYSASSEVKDEKGKSSVRSTSATAKILTGRGLTGPDLSSSRGQPLTAITRTSP